MTLTKKNTKVSGKTDSKDDNKKMKYAKFKLDLDFNTQKLNTFVFLREEGIPVLQDVKTLSGLRPVSPWGSTVQMIVAMNKIWISKSANESGKRKYGVTFKINQLEVVERPEYAGNKASFSTYMMDNSDNDTDDENTTDKPKTSEQTSDNKKVEVKKVEVKKVEAKKVEDTKAKENNESDNDSDNNSDDDTKKVEKKSSRKNNKW